MAKAAAPVKMLILCEDAALEDLVFIQFFLISRQNNTETDEGLAVAVVAVPLDDVVAVAVALLVVNVTPCIIHVSTNSRNKDLHHTTAAQSDWEAASAFVRSDPVHDA
jgi:hypothetical protein